MCSTKQTGNEITTEMRDVIIACSLTSWVFPKPFILSAFDLLSNNCRTEKILMTALALLLCIFVSNFVK